MSALTLDVERELEHEEECLTAGTHKYRNRLIKNQQDKAESRSDYGRRLVSLCIEPLSKAISDFLTKSASKGAGRRHLATTLLVAVKPDVAAFISAREIINGVSKSTIYQAVAGAIGRQVEEEIRFGSFEKQAGPLYRTVQKSFDTNPVIGLNYQTRARVFNHAMAKFKVQFSKWTMEQKFHVGSKLIDLFVESTGLVSLSRAMEHKDTRISLQPSDELLGWIEKFTGYSELMCPDLQPCLIPPRPYTTIFDGGYYHHRYPSQLVKARTCHVKGVFAELESANMPAVYAAVNALQNTSWRINQPMRDLVEEVWNSGVEVKGIPSRFDEELSTRPAGNAHDEATKKAWAKWKHESADIFRRNTARRSKRVALARILHLAEKFKNDPNIFFPVRLDFRGRAYYVPIALNPQGSDLAKSLLTFSEGKPLGERGAYWLAIAVANHFGNDKVSLDERAEWTRQNSDHIVRVANDPLGDLWWTEADKPFQFLAACIEWVGYTTDGPDYVCHLPVLVDGSCNGLQHFAAMLRDEVCGQHVNLVPSEKPGDIYTEVAKALIVRLQEEVKEQGEHAEWAADWLAFGIDRKLSKRPTMVLPYGGTREAFARYLLEFVRESVEKGEKKHSWGKEVTKRVYYLTGQLIRAMDAVIVGPRKVMTWMREAGKIASEDGLPLVWSTPTGFVVSQSYVSLRNRRVKTRVGDSIMKFTLNEETAKLDKRKQATALSPNFVHSLDAAALMQTVNLCGSRGIKNFHAVHDSYGTHPTDMDELARTLREVFVSIYQSDDVLAKLRDELQRGTDVQLPSLPEKGSLSLAGVIQSPYFFA